MKQSHPTRHQAMEDLTRALKGLAGYKANFTRVVNRIASIVPLAENGPTHALCDKITEDLEKLESAFEKLEKRCNDLALVDEDEARLSSYTSTMRTAEEQFSKWRTAAVVILNKQEQRLAPHHAQAAAAQGTAPVARARPIESLKPQKLTRDHTLAELRVWMQQFSDFYEASHLEAAPCKQQQAHFRSCLDSHLQARIRERTGDDSTIEQFCEALHEEFSELYPLFNRRLEFFRATQKTGEKFSDTAMRLQQLADVADLGGLDAEQLMIFRYISAARDEKLREKLLRIEKPTLKLMKATIRAHEAAALTCDAIDAARGRAVDATATAAAAKASQQAGTAWQQLKKRLQGKCHGCGGHMEKGREREHKEACPAKGCTCNKCGKKGHFAKVCLGSNRPNADKPARVASAEEEATDKPERGWPDSANTYSALVMQASSEGAPTPRMKVRVKGTAGSPVTINALPDTGATRSIISERTAERYKIARTPTATHIRILAANGDSMTCAGEAVLRVLKGGEIIHTMRALVVPEIQEDLLIGWQDLKAMGVIPKSFPNTETALSAQAEDQQEAAEELLSKFSDTFSDTVGATPMKGEPMRIHLRDDMTVKPRKTLTARQVPVHWREEAQALVNDLLNREIIEPVTHPTEWISPAFFVPKPGGRGIRMVTDFVSLNRYIKRPVHPFPSALDIVNNIRGVSKK